MLSACKVTVDAANFAETAIENSLQTRTAMHALIQPKPTSSSALAINSLVVGSSIGCAFCLILPTPPDAELVRLSLTSSPFKLSLMQPNQLLRGQRRMLSVQRKPSRTQQSELIRPSSPTLLSPLLHQQQLKHLQLHHNHNHPFNRPLNTFSQSHASW